MSEGPRVSVVTPVRDRVDLLEALLSALERQTFTDFEVVIVDDGSRERVASTVSNSKRMGPPVTVLRTPRRGAVAARRSGVRVARGSILAFTDSDCEPEPAWLAEGVAAIDAGADVVQGKTIPARAVGPRERSISFDADVPLFATCNVFYRRSAFDSAGGFDVGASERFGFRPGSLARGLGFGEDTITGWRVARAGRFVALPEAVVRHAVLRPTFREHVSRAWQVGAFPSLVKEVPELRWRLLKHRVVIGRMDARLLLYATALLAPVVPLASLAVTALWVVSRARDVGSRDHQASSLKLLPSLFTQLATDLTMCAALVIGSIRARTIVI